MISATAEAFPCKPSECGTPTFGSDTVQYACEANAPIVALDNGKVKEVHLKKDCLRDQCPCEIENGVIIDIEHSGGVVSYCHIGYIDPAIRKGAVVQSGQPLGAIGAGGGFSLKIEGTSYTKDDFESAQACQCVPTCSDKNCGDDGCGGTCGTCANNTVCVDGMCRCVAVVDENRECGDDGCGVDFKFCNSMEGSCQYDKKKENYVCKTVDLKTGTTCYPQCQITSGKENIRIRECGDDGCGGTCGTCPDGKVCRGNQCVCDSSCGDRQCGLNACGEPCGTCPDGTSCDEVRGVCQCIDDSMEIHDQNCEDVKCGTADPVCHAICPCVDDLSSTYSNKKCFEDSWLNTCGKYDEMGGRCGYCVKGQSCHIRKGCLVTECDVSCKDAMCGDDGCGGTCGICGPGFHCEDRRCVSGGSNDLSMKSNGCSAAPVSGGRMSLAAVLLSLITFAGMRRRRKAARMQ